MSADGAAIHAGGAAIHMTRDVHLSDTYAAARQARRDAQDAATRSRVRVSEPHSERDIRGIAEVGDQLWGPGGTLAPNELRALIHAGASVHAAFDQQQPGEPMIGFALGFLGWAPAVHLHSHQVGVLSEHRRRGVGYALKLAQRQTCLRFGVTDMRWTFDPLIRRNTAFNLGALGANAASFHPNFYGHMGDAINGEDASDRLEAAWDLLRPLPVRKCSGASRPPAQAPATKAPVLLAEHEGWPRHTHAAPTRGAMIGVPGDYEELRKRDPQCSAAWRAASREVLLQVYAAGLRIGEVDEAGYRLVPNGEV